ncbi:MAG TPA: hypothetical protein VGK32_04425 [Vicinamibacterales bacterium]
MPFHLPAFLCLRAQGAAQADVLGFYPPHDAAVVAAGEAFVADGAMGSAVGLVPLVACANFSGLLPARGAARLGASRPLSTARRRLRG